MSSDAGGRPEVKGMTGYPPAFSPVLMYSCNIQGLMVQTLLCVSDSRCISEAGCNKFPKRCLSLGHTVRSNCRKLLVVAAYVTDKNLPRVCRQAYVCEFMWTDDVCCHFRFCKMYPRHVEKWSCTTVRRCAITL